MSKSCHFAILNCDDRDLWKSFSKTVRENVQGHINRFAEYFVDSFGEAKDTWEVFSCCEFHWPSVEEVSRFDAVFITGSGYSVYDEENKWISPLCNMIQLYIQERTRIVGICFGAQVLAVALGGKVAKNHGPFVAKIEDIHIRPEMSAFIGDVNTVALIESHGDQVIELPPGAAVLGHSSTCKNEIWFLDSALAIQGHPEFFPDVVLKTILPSLKRRKILSTLDVIHSGRNLRNRTVDHQVVISLIKNFTRSEAFITSKRYQLLFPNRIHSITDKAVIQHINTLTENIANQPYAGEPKQYRNPVDQDIKQFVQKSVNVLTDQFSSLMLKELKHTMIAYQGLDQGNTCILEDGKVLLSQTLDLYKPIKQLRSQRLMLSEEINQVVNEVSTMMTSLEESARLLERETNNLKARILQ